MRTSLMDDCHVMTGSVVGKLQMALILLTYNVLLNTKEIPSAGVGHIIPLRKLASKKF